MVASSVLMLCSLLLLMNLGTAKAHALGYDFQVYDAVRTPTIDGMWTTQDEWTDAGMFQMSPNGVWLIKCTTVGGFKWIWILIEFFSDSTSDVGDYWDVIFDSTHDGGTAPNAGDYRIQPQSHTTSRVWQGTGVWTGISSGGYTGTNWANTLGTSPLNGTMHWIFELSIDMGEWLIPNAPPFGFRTGAWDASTNTMITWPPGASPDIPNQWGTLTAYAGTPIPEGFSLIVIVLLSSAAAIVGFRYLRKHPKTKTPTTIKL